MSNALPGRGVLATAWDWWTATLVQKVLIRLSYGTPSHVSPFCVQDFRG